MRLQHILLEPNKTEYIIKSKQKIIPTKELKFYTLNPNVKIHYKYINDKTFKINIENPVEKNTNLLYELDLDYEKIFDPKIDGKYKFPRIIHQSYKSKKGIEEHLNKIKNEWLKLNTNYKYKFYDDIDCIDFFDMYFDEYFVDIFKSIPQGAIKCDFWRLCILYIFGGTYADIDFVPYKSIESIVGDNNFVGVVDMSHKVMFNAFIHSNPRNPILLDSILRFLEIDVKNIKWTIGAFQSCYDLLYSIKKEIFNDDPQKIIPHILLNGEYKESKVKIIQEVLCGDNVYEFYVIDNGVKVFKSRREDYDYKTHKFIDTTKECLITQE